MSLNDISKNSTWTLVKATPLWNFSDDLPTYEEALRLAFSSSCTVNIAWVEKKSRSTQKCLVVSIEKETEEETIQRGRLIFYPAVEALKEPEFTSFPLILSHGRATLITTALQWFTNEFDFHTTPFHIPPHELAIVTLWSENESLELTLSTDNPNLTEISVAFTAEAISSLYPVNNPDSLQEKSRLFLNNLYARFSQHFQISLDSFRLTTVGTAWALISSTGKVKIKRKAATVLDHLLQIDAAK